MNAKLCNECGSDRVVLTIGRRGYCMRHIPEGGYEIGEAPTNAAERPDTLGDPEE